MIFCAPFNQLLAFFVIVPYYYSRPHYNVIMKEVEVGGDVLPLPTDVFDSGDGKGTIIDSGTTLTYLPDEVYKQLMNAVYDLLPFLLSSPLKFCLLIYLSR